MKRTIYIGDMGTASQCELDDNGQLAVTYTGGCPVAKILHDLNPSWSNEKLAREVLNRWMTGYDGDPEASGLYVEVIDTQEFSSTAYP